VKRLFAVLVLASLPCFAQVFYTAVDLQPQANKRLDNLDIPYPTTFPKGNVQFAGVPFNIPVVGNSVWLSADAPGGPVVSVTWSVNIPEIVGFYTLINTYFGTAGGPYAFAVFGFADSPEYWWPLYGNDDIRDYNPNNFTNTINNTSTVGVFLSSTGMYGTPRMDMQYFDLQKAGFAGKTLTAFSLYDYGGFMFQRTFLAGATAASIPESSSLSLLALGGLVVALGRRKK